MSNSVQAATFTTYRDARSFKTATDDQKDQKIGTRAHVAKKKKRDHAQYQETYH